MHIKSACCSHCIHLAVTVTVISNYSKYYVNIHQVNSEFLTAGLKVNSILQYLFTYHILSL